MEVEKDRKAGRAMGMARGVKTLAKGAAARIDRAIEAIVTVLSEGVGGIGGKCGEELSRRDIRQ